MKTTRYHANIDRHFYCLRSPKINLFLFYSKGVMQLYKICTSIFKRNLTLLLCSQCILQRNMEKRLLYLLQTSMNYLLHSQGPLNLCVFEMPALHIYHKCTGKWYLGTHEKSVSHHTLEVFEFHGNIHSRHKEQTCI